MFIESKPASFKSLAQSANFSAFDVNFTFDEGSTHTGFLALGTQANGNQVLYYTVPKTYVDISYGDNAIGWDDYVHDGAASGHTYGEIEGSDKLQFTTKDGDAVSFELKGNIKSGSSIISTAATSLEYNRGLTGFTENYSPELNGANPDYTNDSDANYLNSSNSDWIFDVAYEIEFEANTFDTADWNAGNIASLFQLVSYENHGEHGQTNIEFDSFFGGHASPSKLSVTSTVFTSCDDTSSGLCDGGTPPTGDVPVPGTAWLALVGFAGLYRFRSKA